MSALLLAVLLLDGPPATTPPSPAPPAADAKRDKSLGAAAKRVPSVEDSLMRPISLLPEMARIAAEMVHDVLDAFAARDSKKAVAVTERDAAVDDFYNSIFRSLLTHMMENPHNITPATHLLFVARNLERIGDHATNVAEMVYFAATGDYLADRPKGADTTVIGAELRDR